MSQHMPTFAENPSVRLMAVCDADPQRVDAALAAAGATAEYGTTDYKRILADERIEAVFVCTPPWVTPGITIDALSAGKHVLCEKPMATSLEDAERVAEAERVSGKLLQVGFTYRHGPLMDALQRWIAEGRLGRPLQIRISVYDEVWDPTGNPELYDRIFHTLRHGPPCIHDGAHSADHLAFLTGSTPVKVTAQGLKTRPEFPAPNYNTAIIEFANGDQAKLEVAWFLPHFPPGEFQIMGPSGTAYMDRVNNEAVLVQGKVTERVQLGENRVRSCFRTQLEKFVTSVRAGTTPVPGSREGIASLKLTQAIAHAMESGTPVSMSPNSKEASAQ